MSFLVSADVFLLLIANKKEFECLKRSYNIC